LSKNPGFTEKRFTPFAAKDLSRYAGLRETIEKFWLEGQTGKPTAG